MKILVVGINFDPEPVGIGPYTGDMVRWLSSRGHEVDVVAAKPYYPAWRVDPGYRRSLYVQEQIGGARVIRCPLYVPSNPGGIRRIAHHLTFAASAALPLIGVARRRPDVVFTVAPSLAAAGVAWLAAKAAGAPAWLHIQDFEVGAALATGLLRPGSTTARLAAGFEKIALRGFQHYSSISPQMCRRLETIGIERERISEFRNWADPATMEARPDPHHYRSRWGIRTPHVVLYSGNIANKQGVDVIVKVARHLRHRADLSFVICGEGPTREALIRQADGLANIRFEPLQPRERLPDLLALATIHILPQLPGAADLVLPSKLTNMLASGRPVVATAAPGTGLAAEVADVGEVVPPGDVQALANAISGLIDDPARYRRLADAARARAEERWSRESILTRFEAELTGLAARVPS